MGKTGVRRNYYHGQYNGTSYVPRPCAKKKGRGETPKRNKKNIIFLF
jgi:hypothetical protein